MRAAAASSIAPHAAIACLVGLAALTSPPLALVSLAGLGARALIYSRQSPSLVRSAGPLALALPVTAFCGLSFGVGAVFAWVLIADALRRQREIAAIAETETARPSARHLATAAFALIAVAASAPHSAFGLPLDLPRPPAALVWAGAGLVILTVCDWTIRCAADWRLGAFAARTRLHEAGAHALYLCAFVLQSDVSAGLAAMIAWRLAQAQPRLHTQLNFTAVP
jgi:hypothetical protein